ncbi:unnamed protein product, partial [Adineta steineri]
MPISPDNKDKASSYFLYE